MRHRERKVGTVALISASGATRKWTSSASKHLHNMNDRHSRQQRSPPCRYRIDIEHTNDTFLVMEHRAPAISDRALWLYMSTGSFQ